MKNRGKKKGYTSSRRRFLKSVAASAAALLGACGNIPTLYCAEPSRDLRVGYLPITDASPLLIAHALGYFQDEGLKVERPLMVRSWSALIESFLSGKFNMTHMLLPIPVWMRFKHNISIKVLAWDHVNGSAVTVARDSGIEGFADLAGRQIAVPYWYSMHNIVLQMGLRASGLEPVIQDQSAPLGPRQVNLFVLSPPEMPAALAGGKIDGYVVAEPFNALGELKLGARIMRFTGDIWKNHPCCVVVMNEADIRTRPVFTQKAINAVVRAQRWISHNRAEAAKLLSRDGMGYLPVPRAVLLRVFTGYGLSRYAQGPAPHAIHHPSWRVARIGFQPYPYPSATRLIIRAMGQTRMEGDSGFLEGLNPETAVKDLVDDRFVKKAILDMGGPQHFSDVDLKHPWEREEVIEI